MSGIEEILNIIDSQQKQTEDNLVSAAEHKASAIIYDGNEKAEKAYEEHIKKMTEQLAHDFDNACSSADAAMKRRVLEDRAHRRDYRGGACEARQAPRQRVFRCSRQARG